MVPSKAHILQNRFGTAPGMWMEQDDCLYISLPGVPYEMKNLIANEVLPKIVEKFHRPFIIHKTIMTYGLGESAIAERISEMEEQLPALLNWPIFQIWVK